MNGFSAEWLTLREPADLAARVDDVTQAVIASLAHRESPLVIDIGCGTGSNVRYLARCLPASTRWRLLDHDRALLDAARASLGMSIDTRIADLRVLDPGIFTGADLVTASALLDLVSATWLRDFVGECRRAGAAVLVALNYDGRITCTPADDDDELVRELVNRHQRTDKGFGPALGPEAGDAVVALLRDAGYQVVSARSDWRLEPDQAELQRQLVSGWASAAIERSPAETVRIRSWESRRLQTIDVGISHIVVGHVDVGGEMSGTRDRG
ncbi:MAG: class I SAM-dependent methyltransferase [Vicinamibacterales bacterium]